MKSIAWVAVLAFLLAFCVIWGAWQVLAQQPAPMQPKATPGAAPAGSPDIVQWADPAADGLKATSGTTLLKGGEFAVRGRDEQTFTADTKRVPYEVYRDEDFGTLAYVTQSGNVSAMPYRKNFELRSLGLGDGYFEVVRFSPATGVSWRMKNQQWSTIAESRGSGMPRPGSYEVQLTNIGGAAVMVRIDQRTGNTWMMVDDVWRPVTDEGSAPPMGATPKKN